MELGTKVSKLALYEAPYNDDPAAQQAWKEYLKGLGEALADGRRGDAVALFMEYTGMTDEQIEGMRHAPFWPAFEVIAPTLAYDHAAILGETAGVPVDLAAQIAGPTLAMSGGASYWPTASSRSTSRSRSVSGSATDELRA